MNKYEKNADYSYAIGTTVVFELLRFRPELGRKLYLSPKLNKDQTYEELIALCRSHHILVISNNEKIFKDISGKDNVMALMEFKKQSFALDKNNDHCLLVNPSNMGNLGTIIRSMVGFSLFDLAIITPACDVYDPKVIRASMGAFFHCNIELYASLEEYQAKYNVGRSYYPFMLQASIPLKKCTPKKPWTIIFGNEATGLPREYLNLGQPVIIPHTGFVDSLNLDNAAAIGIYEFTKDRNN